MTKIRYGMVGGGQGGFIGPIHRMAANLDGEYTLVAGALSSDAERAYASGQELGLDPERIYTDFAEMARQEAQRDDGIEVVSIVTPNHMHYPAAKAFLEAGIHVICDKPLTTTLDDARTLVELTEKSRKVFMVTYNYTGYPLVRAARSLVQLGDLGEIRLVQVEYVQGWLSDKIEDYGHKQASWRTDPSRSGPTGCLGDIGTHAYHLACFITGLKLASVRAELHTFVSDRLVDDNVHAMLHFEGGARGILWASQVSPGNENGLRIRVYGTKAGLCWSQEEPNVLDVTSNDGSLRRITRGSPESGEAASRVSRMPPGHPEGYLEAFATLYREAAGAIRALGDGASYSDDVDFPTVKDGLKGIQFVTACLDSSRQAGKLVTMD